MISSLVFAVGALYLHSEPSTSSTSDGQSDSQCECAKYYNHIHRSQPTTKHDNAETNQKYIQKHGYFFLQNSPQTTVKKHHGILI